MTFPPLPYPALHASHAGVWIADAEGCRAVGRGEAIRHAADTPMIVLNAPLIGQRLGYGDLSGLDLLELHAFLRPAVFIAPTPRGFARALGLAEPATEADIAPFLREAAAAMLAIPQGDWPEREGAWTAAQSLTRLRWPWAPALADRIARPREQERWLFSRLPEWEETSPRPAPRIVTLDEGEVGARLFYLTGAGA